MNIGTIYSMVIVMVMNGNIIHGELANDARGSKPMSTTEWFLTLR